ncbi:hypothetical protein [Nocardioides sp. SR21]|uniref:hypothetical protein n=1 Tax=Nocardioides sp. SR21 TaxID=2919501 RepID=UPI001FAB13DD|nr:hypothetical protein [Nocardioides sp. SR21]
MDASDWFLVAVTSGLVAGVANNLTSLLTNWLDRRARKTEREAEEAHAASLRREAAHDAARATFLPMAESLALWATKLAYDIHFEDVGAYHFPGTEKTVLSKTSEVLDVARAVAWGHPTKSVRTQADALYESLADRFGDVDRAREDLTQAEASTWQSQAEELIRLIHTPET